MRPSRVQVLQSPVVRIRCSACGRGVALSGDYFLCACGKEVGGNENGVLVVSPPTPYWGEIPQPQMSKLLRDCRRDGWRHATGDADPDWCDSVMKPERAAFQDVLPILDDSWILDVGAGMGCLAVELAKRHRVVALEGVRERAEFIAVRKQQDKIENLAVLNADLNSVRFVAGQFDAVIVNGVLEWVGLFDTSVPPKQAQIRFLERLRESLKPNGYIYLAIENRIGWNQLRGIKDHSGLPYTSLMPRFLARLVCQSAFYRSDRNAGYRTYTYTIGGYHRLFRRAGLAVRSTWIAPLGYNMPTELIPISRPAIEHYTTKWLSPNLTWKSNLRNEMKRVMAHPFVWRNFGSDFVFLLGHSNA